MGIVKTIWRYLNKTTTYFGHLSIFRAWKLIPFCSSEWEEVLLGKKYKKTRRRGRSWWSIRVAGWHIAIFSLVTSAPRLKIFHQFYPTIVYIFFLATRWGGGLKGVVVSVYLIVYGCLLPARGVVKTYSVSTSYRYRHINYKPRPIPQLNNDNLSTYLAMCISNLAWFF